MAGRGRGLSFGRGRASLQPLRKPQKVEDTTVKVSVNSMTIDDVTKKFKALSFNMSDTDVTELQSAIEMYCSNAEKLTDLVKQLHDICIQDSNLTKAAAMLCNTVGSMEVEGVKFRSLLLSSLQQDFKDKETLRKQNVLIFINSFIFLCDVFRMLRVAEKPLAVLTGPIFDWLMLLIDMTASEEETEIACEQLMQIGELLEKHGSKEKMNSVMDCIRTKLCSEEISSIERYHLLCALEHYLCNWLLPEATVTTYSNLKNKINQGEFLTSR